MQYQEGQQVRGPNGEMGVVRNGHIEIVQPGGGNSVITHPADPDTAASRHSNAISAALAAQAAALRLRQLQRDEVTATGGAGVPGNASLTGEAYLRSLPESMQSQVRALSEGRIAMPTGRAAATPYWEQIMQATGRYDPTFDAANYQTRVHTRQDFTSGQARRNITALNTALEHLDTLAGRAEALDNGSWHIINSVRNSYRDQTGDPRVNNFNQARQAVVTEMARVFQGAAPQMAEIEHWRETINAAQSPAQLHDAIRGAVALLDGRLNALGDQYNAGMGRSDQALSLLDPRARQIHQALGEGGAGVGALPRAPGDAPPVIGGAPASGPPPTGGLPPPAAPGGEQLDRGNRPMLPGGGDQVGLATDQMHTVPDPTVAGVNARVDHMLRTGVPDEEIRAYVQNLPRTPGRDISLSGVDGVLAWRRAHPSYRGSYNPDLENMVVPVSLPRQIATNIADSAPGAYVTGAGNALTAGFLPELTPGNTELNRAGINEIAARHPVANAVGNVSGGVLASLAPEAAAARWAPAGLTALLARAPRLTQIGTDAAYGAAYGAGANPDDRIGGALTGLATAPVVGATVRVAARTVGRALTGTRDQAVRMLAQAGIPLTIGQMVARGGIVGRTVKGVEDRLSGIPYVGDIIRARTREGTEGFNRAAFQEALAPIATNASDQIAETGVQDAQDAVGRAYSGALGGVNLNANDPQFVQEMGQALNHGRSIPRLGEDFHYLMQDAIGPLIDRQGNMSGENLQAALQTIRRARTSYAGDPLGHNMGGALTGVEDALTGLTQRQAPHVMPALNAANDAYGRLSTVQNAVLRGANTEGVFSPAQLGMASRQNAIRYGGRNAAAAGDRPFMDLQRAGQQVLPTTVPDSGTAGRLLLPALGAALGGGAGYADDGGAGAAKGLTIGALLSAPYTRPGRAMLQTLIVGERMRALNELGQAFAARAQLGGAAAIPLAIQATSGN